MTTANDIKPLTDALLMRRPPAFFIGKVLRVSREVSDHLGPYGQGPGYYRCRLDSDTQTWSYDWLGTTEPEGEPIYRWHTHDQADLWAIPRTVWTKEIRNSFILWGLLVVGLWLVAGIMGGYTQPFESGWKGSAMFGGAVVLGPMMIAPVIKYGRAIEPVFTMKCLYVAMLTWTVIRSNSERTHQQVKDDQRNREVGRPEPNPIHAHWDAIQQRERRERYGQQRDEVRHEVRQYLREQGRGW